MVSLLVAVFAMVSVVWMSAIKQLGGHVEQELAKVDEDSEMNGKENSSEGGSALVGKVGREGGKQEMSIGSVVIA